MIPKDQICKLFMKQLEKHPDYKPTSIIVQLIQIKPFMVSDGLTKIQLYSSETLNSIKQEVNEHIHLGVLINSFLVLQQIDFVVDPSRYSDCIGVKLVCQKCSLLVPGMSTEKWGNPIPIEKKIDGFVFGFLKKVSLIIRLSNLNKHETSKFHLLLLSKSKLKNCERILSKKNLAFMGLV